jgi:hypothetical protein
MALSLVGGIVLLYLVLRPKASPEEEPHKPEG